jgi:hypothetical protein
MKHLNNMGRLNNIDDTEKAKMTEVLRLVIDAPALEKTENKRARISSIM